MASALPISEIKHTLHVIKSPLGGDYARRPCRLQAARVERKLGCYCQSPGRFCAGGGGGGGGGGATSHPAGRSALFPDCARFLIAFKADCTHPSAFAINAEY